MTREKAIAIAVLQTIRPIPHRGDGKSTTHALEIIAFDMAIKALQAWDKFKQALDKRILEQGFDEDEWSVSYNELIKMMKKCGGVE